MKKLGSLFVMMFLLVGSLGFVVAEEHEDVVPEAKKIGFFENFGDRVNLAFTFSKEKRIEKSLVMAEKRLAEAELLAEEDPEAYVEAQEKYDELVARAEEALADIELRAENTNASVDEMEQIARIQDKFERHRAHADEIYTRVLEKFEENNASSEKIERFEMFYERALNRSYEMEIRVIEKRERAIERHGNLSELSDDEITEVLVEIEEREGLRESREDRKVRAETRIERVNSAKGDHIARMRFSLRDSGLTGEERAEIEIRIRESTRDADHFEVRVRERIETENMRVDIRERVRDGEVRTEVRIRERDDTVEDALRLEEDALKAAEDAAEDALRLEEDALKAAEDAAEDALKAAEDALGDADPDDNSGSGY